VTSTNAVNAKALLMSKTQLVLDHRNAGVLLLVESKYCCVYTNLFCNVLERDCDAVCDLE
jgi:hypothetical protein